MSNDNPLAYTARVPASTTRLGIAEFDPTSFSVSESGVVSINSGGTIVTSEIAAPAGSDLSLKMGDAAGATTVSFLDSADAEVAFVDSNGNATFVSVTATSTVLAGTTITAGTGLIATTGGVTATAGGVTATAGGVTATAGDITATAGHVIINGAGRQLRVHGGAATDFIGAATLVAGTVTVLNTNIAATDKIMVSRRGINGSTALGVFDVAITAATSFSITSLNPTDATTQTNDTSIVDYLIVRQV